MCGRFYMNKETKELVQSVVETYEDVQDSQNITPGAEISVIYMKDSHLESVHMYWGYSLALSSKLVINARCETVLDKKMFKNDIQKEDVLFLQQDSMSGIILNIRFHFQMIKI